VDDAPLYRCITKGTDRMSGPPRRSAHWATSRRGTLRIYTDRVELGDWRIPHADVREARAYSIPSLLGRGLVLELRTDTKTYQFGINPWARPLGHLPYPVQVQDAGLGLTASSVALRLSAIVVIGFIAWQDWTPGHVQARSALDLILLGLLAAPLITALVKRSRRG
jgi:hypothetical protein